MTNYDAFAETFSNSRKDMHWPEVDAILDDISTNQYQKLLDIGCGNGRFLGELQKKSQNSMRYLGVDSSEKMIAEARRLHPKAVFLMSTMPELKEIPNEQHFDAIILLASFHHLENESSRIACLLRLKELLTPNGSIYMTNWNLLGQERYKKNHRGSGDFDIKIGEFTRYYHGFSLEELEHLFEQTGWKIKKNRLFEGGRNIYSILTIPCK